MVNMPSLLCQLQCQHNRGGEGGGSPGEQRLLTGKSVNVMRAGCMGGEEGGGTLQNTGKVRRGQQDTNTCNEYVKRDRGKERRFTSKKCAPDTEDIQ